MLSKPTAISWWESNSASLHQTQGDSKIILGLADAILDDSDRRFAEWVAQGSPAGA